jgi:hypothetical protein
MLTRKSKDKWRERVYYECEMGNALDRMLSVAERAVDIFDRVQGNRSDGGRMRVRTARRDFRVIAAHEESGEPCWVVTNGYDRAVCNSPTFAEKVKEVVG